MSVSSDLIAAQIATNQGSQSVKPNTIASTTTIAPTSFITFVSGTIDISTVTPPLEGQHMLALIFTDATPGDITTTGNVPIGSTTIVQNVPMLLFYDPLSGDYYPANLGT